VDGRDKPGHERINSRAMYDIKWIRDHPQDFDRGLNRRPLSEEDRERFSSGALLALDEERRKAITYLENALARRNVASKEIGEAKKRKDDAHAEDLMIEVAQLKRAIPELEKTPRELQAKLDGLLAQIPNTPLDEVPDGKDEHGNVPYKADDKTRPKKRDYAFKPKQHFELGEALGQMDFELAAKLSGARFVVLQKGLARMERALGQFMLDVHIQPEKENSDSVKIGGYAEVNPPVLVKDDTMFGTAQLPKFRDDQFPTKVEEEIEENEYEISPDREGNIGVIFHGNRRAQLEEKFFESPKLNMRGARLANGTLVGARPVIEDRLWLIPTAEVPLTNLVRESIIEEATLPRRYTACTPCFRAEAGAAGKDTRGMIRQHQFTKVELVSITTPEQSKAEHERMLNCAEEILKKLDLHYRVITLCTGDMGFASQKTYDIEVWLPGQGQYREISSCSVCGDFQARRMNARYRGKDGKPRFVHTLNGSGVAVGRALIAVMETYQQEDGSIAVPDALAPYMGGLTKIEKTQ
jgi:seryl-tRNA synthetase